MGIAKVTLNNETLMDITDDTVTASGLMLGDTAHGADGESVTGTYEPVTYDVATETTDGLMSASDKVKLNGVATGAEVNQNAFSNVKVGTTTIEADSKTDTLTLTAGTNITLTPNATSDSVTIAVNGMPSKVSDLDNDSGFITSSGTAANVSGTVAIENGGTGAITASAARTNLGLGSAATAAPGNVASSSAVGTSANYARQDHTHGISLATGDSDGQVKIAGTNVDVKGLEPLAYSNGGAMYYGTCSTAAGTAAKVIELVDPTGFELKPGVMIAVKFSANNSASNVSLNVEGTGAKQIWYNTSVYTSTSTSICGIANRPIYYMYDGTYWVFQSQGILNSDTYPSAYCTTSGSVAAKVATCTNYVAKANSWVQILFQGSNSSASAITLNINSKGAKPIYINGSASSSSNYALPAGTYLTFYDGTNYYFRTDGKLPGDVASLSSPALTGTPTAPTAVSGTNTTQIATTAFVNQELNPQIVTLTPGTDVTFARYTAYRIGKIIVMSGAIALSTQIASGATLFTVDDYASQGNYEFILAQNGSSNRLARMAGSANVMANSAIPSGTYFFNCMYVTK